MAPQAADALTADGRTTRIKALALALGFADAGVADLSPLPHADALDDWLAAGRAGTMTYMHRQARRRQQPALIVDGADKAVVVLYNYAHESGARPPRAGRVAAYARGLDYHAALAPALAELAEALVTMGGPGSIAHPFVDAGPVPERELAQRAGLGWIGKNTMLIAPGRGSYTLLGSILTNVDLRIDRPFDADRCGSCTRCLEACPTGAFPAARVLDATRCISYLTIEFRGEVPTRLARDMAPWIFGCDVCQEVCPWNRKFARGDGDRILKLDADREWIPLDEFAALDERDFVTRYGWTPLARPGLAGMRRNAGVVRNTAPECGEP